MKNKKVQEELKKKHETHTRKTLEKVAAKKKRMQGIKQQKKHDDEDR